ncbi:MAG: hypothetical protein GTO67_10705 [Gammaproteobacteria bacterium]|nr:hypothetical protein [Gammaproteobacteria bacterium]NIO25950.1 hypothetical protein [Gammaproteobacteria bacterium]NIO66580.1 hypothetical protein [Gammaproteobacteria bacterium]NIP45268.1 hypothetical protein [Gammaproteobacteria bacterium]NIP65614.1 hypothetical protein [Gammaproteobacteria bacterium]
MNSRARGCFDTTPIATFSKHTSSFGILDVAGQMFARAATSAGGARAIVVGGCRPAARHSRPVTLEQTGDRIQTGA